MSPSRFRFHERTIDFEQLDVQMGDKTMRISVMVGGTVLIATLVFLGLTVLGAIF